MVATICTKQPFSFYHFKTEGNGSLYVSTERNHFIQTGPYAAWSSTSVDFIRQLPNWAEYTQIMVVVDRFTKMAHFIGFQEKATAKEVAEAFLNEV